MKRIMSAVLCGLFAIVLTAGIAAAGDKRNQLEYTLFQELRTRIAEDLRNRGYYWLSTPDPNTNGNYGNLHFYATTEPHTDYIYEFYGLSVFCVP